mmetsp:Transcript_43057/g.101125  ORF Transcript_43057/g.101125 Transcript_43057/m.101125 type:complete len:397 (-) Transcript_43057:11-1201(-)
MSRRASTKLALALAAALGAAAKPLLERGLLGDEPTASSFSATSFLQLQASSRGVLHGALAQPASTSLPPPLSALRGPNGTLLQQQLQQEEELSNVASCERSFDQCWDDVEQVWDQSSEVCRRAGPLCEAILCESRLDHERCAVDLTSCLYMSRMCLQMGLSPKVESSLASEPAVHKTNLVFMHIPKNAGNTVESVGLKYNEHWGINLRRQKLLHPYCMWHHTPPEVLADPFVYEQADAVFCVVRHPYERAVSEYKYLLDVPWGWMPLSSKGELFDHPPCTPEGLNHFVQTTLRIQQQSDPFLNDCHVLPQVSYIYGREQQWCTEVLNITTLKDDFNSLMRRYGLSARMTGDEKDNSNDECNITSASLYPDTLVMLDQAYQLDFRLLGFATGSVAQQ